MSWRSVCRTRCEFAIYFLRAAIASVRKVHPLYPTPSLRPILQVAYLPADAMPRSRLEHRETHGCESAPLALVVRNSAAVTRPQAVQFFAERSRGVISDGMITKQAY